MLNFSLISHFEIVTRKQIYWDQNNRKRWFFYKYNWNFCFLLTCLPGSLPYSGREDKVAWWYKALQHGKVKILLPHQYVFLMFNFICFEHSFTRLPDCISLIASKQHWNTCLWNHIFIFFCKYIKNKTKQTKIFLGNIKVSLIKYSVKFKDVTHISIFFFPTGKSGSLLLLLLFACFGFDFFKVFLRKHFLVRILLILCRYCHFHL